MFCQSGFQFFQQVLYTSNFNYLEIGVFDGDSIAGIAQRHPNKTVYAIDPFIEDGNTVHTTNVERGNSMPKQKENTYKNIKDLSNIVLFETTSGDFAKLLTDEMITDMNVGWVLIDGSHYYEDIVVDMHMAMRLIGDKPGGIVFDDVNLPGVGQAYREWLEIYKDQVGPVTDVYPGEPGHILAHLVNAKG